MTRDARGLAALLALCWGSLLGAEDDDGLASARGGALPEAGDEFYFHCGFESDTWYERWGARRSPGRVSLVDQDPERKFEPLRGRALRVQVEQGGHYGLSLMFPFQRQWGHEPEAVYFRYYLRLADDWDPPRGGKFPGFSGTYGRAGWGGRPVDGTDGWSARGLFDGQRDGRTPIGWYSYHMDMRGRYGSHWRWEIDQGGLENNRWYCIEQYVRLNHPERADGILRGWVDGQLVLEKTDLRFRAVDTLRVQAVWVNIYLGGSWTAERDHHLYLDEMVISKQPIGPLP